MSAIHFLYVRFADDVFGYVSSIVHDSHEAEDITQNVFAKLSTAIRKYEPRQVPFTAWILRVARNAAVDHLRARRQIPFEQVRTDDDGHDQIGFERSQSLRDALWRLPEEQREVLVLRHLVGLSPLEIARRLGKTEGSIHGLHHRGRSALRLRCSRWTPARSWQAPSCRRRRCRPAGREAGSASVTPSFRKLFLRCHSTVLTVTTSCSAISRLENPSAARVATWRSRVVSASVPVHRRPARACACHVRFTPRASGKHRGATALGELESLLERVPSVAPLPRSPERRPELHERTRPVESGLRLPKHLHGGLESLERRPRIANRAERAQRATDGAWLAERVGNRQLGFDQSLCFGPVSDHGYCKSRIRAP